MGNITKSLWTNIKHAIHAVPIGTDLVAIAHAAGTDLVTQINECTVAELATAAAALLNVTSGLYLPVASVLVNLDGATPNASTRYSRVGNVVFVSGLINLNPTAGGAASVRLTVPIVSAFAAVTDASGNFCDAILDQGRISAVAATALVILEFTAVSVVDTTYGFNFSYSVI